MDKCGCKIDVTNNVLVISELQAGNEQCFDVVYRFYYRWLCSFASRYVSEDRAEEIVQDTMMWLWENRDKLMSEMSLKSLLFMIVKNKSLNRISHNQIKNRVHKLIEAKFEKEFDDPDFYAETELFARFSEAIGRLPYEYRQAFEMHRMEALTHREIAEKLKVSPQTVNYRIGQAMKILRVELKEYLPILLIWISLDQ